MDTIGLYKHNLQERYHSREKSQRDIDKITRRRQVQNEYYKRRGFFMCYRRKIATKLGLSLHELKEITDIHTLEQFCSNFLSSKNITCTDKPSAYVLKIYKPEQ